MITNDNIKDVVYFVQEKGDVARLSYWDQIKKDFYQEYPEFEKAERDLRAAEKIFELVVEGISDDIIFDE